MFAAKSLRPAPRLAARDSSTRVSRGARPTVRRAVDPNYVVDEPHVGREPKSPPRVFFARNSAVVPSAERGKLDAFKTGAERTAAVTLLGLATEDEIAADRSLPANRAKAVDRALGEPGPSGAKHEGPRTIMPGTVWNTVNTPDLRFNRAVEILRPGQLSLSPESAPPPPGPCDGAKEAGLQEAKALALGWMDATRAQLTRRPVAGPIAYSLDQFFGSHDASTAGRVEHNLGLIRAEVVRLAEPDHHRCAAPNLADCVDAGAFNRLGEMIVCADYQNYAPGLRARVLVHEAGHTPSLNLRVGGARHSQGARDYAYAFERFLRVMARTDTDRALSNADSYALLVTTTAAPGVHDMTDAPPDPAPPGFARGADAERAGRALALAEISIRHARQALVALHAWLGREGVGSRVPDQAGDPRRYDRLLAELKRRFPPILSGPTIGSDDLLMIAGVLDRYFELDRLVGRPIATSLGPATELTVPAGGALTLRVSPAFLAAQESARVRMVIEKLVEHIARSRISEPMQPAYTAFALLAGQLYR